MRGRTRIVAATVATLALLAPTQALADGSHPPAPRALLGHAGHGTAVVAALGDRLPAAAAMNRMSTTELRDLLASDSTAWVGNDGRVFYVDRAQSLSATATATTTTATTTYPASSTFALHSLPGSLHTIYLDFNGADVSGTYWNDHGMPAQFYSGFTLDGDPSTFTSAELAYIQQVWQIVAEKYAPFDVDVTTADPGPAGYNRSGLLDLTYGDHVVITDNSTAVNTACGGTCSGIALLGTFDQASDSNGYLEPAWVFSSKTSKSAVLTAHTVAHEVGHTFGLRHDGDTTQASPEYDSGHGNWFPIMGSSARAVGQFSKGEYAGANNTEDDLAVIAAHGAPLRLDDHSDTMLLAEPLATGSAVAGVISTRADRDVFAVAHNCTTDLTAAATGIGPGASLDLSVTVLSAAGTVIATADPGSSQDTSVWPAVPTGMDARVTVPATNALYYVRVDGVGHGSALTDGYSDYGSVGLYQLAISGCDGSMPAATTFVTTSGTSSTTVRAPSAPRIGLASSGRRGHPITARARWYAPVSNGGAAIVGYRIKALRLSASGRVVGVVSSRMLSAGSHAKTMRLPKGKYRFRVVAYNRVGSAVSATSRIVRAR
jgi:hypothetical protein